MGHSFEHRVVGMYDKVTGRIREVTGRQLVLWSSRGTADEL